MSTLDGVAQERLDALEAEITRLEDSPEDFLTEREARLKSKIEEVPECKPTSDVNITMKAHLEGLLDEVQNHPDRVVEGRLSRLEEEVRRLS